MSSKLRSGNDLLFLFCCLEASNYTSINFEAVAAATGSKAPAARLRFNHLSKALGSAALASASDSDQAVSKIGLTTSNEAKQAARTSKIDDQDEVAVSGDGHNKLDHNKTPIKTKFESVEPRLIVPPAPRKRRNRGKKIDLSAASESDTSPTPLARKRKLVDINDKEDDQNTAQGIDSFIELSGEKSTSVPRWLLKSESKKRLNQPDSSSASVIKELPHFLQTGTKKAPTRSPSKPTATARSHSARRSNTKSVVRNGPTSPFVPLPELKLYRPGLSTSGTAQRKAPKSLLNDETIPNIMPSIEHDDVNWLGSREAGKGGSSAPDAESDMNDDGESESQDLLAPTPSQRSMGPEPEERHCNVASAPRCER